MYISCDFVLYSAGEYTQLRESQERPKKVRDLLTNLNDKSLIERFDRALKAFSATRTGTTERTAASLEMRTLLDGLKGYLWKTARRHDRENMKWELMAERLAKGMVGGYEWQTLIEQESKYTQLFNTLSAVGKDRTSITQERLDLLWGQLLDHIQVVLTMIKT
jgi:hypothetical protein